MNPYLLLDVTRSADDPTIRWAYLQAIKQATPETQPERFRMLTEAYETIKDETSRYRYELFHKDVPGDSPLDVVLRRARLGPPPKPLNYEAMKEYLRSCSKT